MESLFYRNYLKYLRNNFYIVQSEIADFLYCSISTYSKMEQGKKEIRFKDFETVIHFYEKKNKGYSFCFDKNKKKEAKDLIRKCIIDFVYRSQKEILDELATMQKCTPKNSSGENPLVKKSWENRDDSPNDLLMNL